MSKEFDWVENYFCARFLLGFSEKEFWESNPRKINALIWALKAHKGHAITKSDPKHSADELIALLKL